MEFYQIRQIKDSTWQIFEPLGVGCFLFTGRDRALLLDTGNGFRNLRRVVAKLTDKPLTVLNTHGHADHTGGNAQFRQVHIHADDLSMTDAAWQKRQHDLLFGYARTHYPLLRPLLWWIMRARTQFFDTEYITIEDGMRFDLGGRVLTVIHCPGHSPGSILLTDEAARTLYVGDAVNPGLFLFFKQSPTLRAYAEQLREFSRLTGFDEIRGSHTREPLPFVFISWYADFLERVTLEKSVKTHIPNNGRDVYVYKEDGKPFGLKYIAVHFTKDLLETEE